VTFLADGELVWAAPAVQAPRLVLLASAPVSGTPGAGVALFEDTGLAGAIGTVGVAAGDTADELFAVAQFPAPTSLTRRTAVTRHDALAAAGGAPFVPVWSFEPDELVNGAALLDASRDGARLALALHDSAGGRVLVFGLSPATGASTFETELVGNGLRSLDLSADGTRLCVGVGTLVHVLDAASGAAVDVIDEVESSGAVALSADGRRVAVGSIGGLTLLEDAGSGYGVLLSRLASGELVTATALSDDGATLAAGWWNHVDGVGVRVERVDVATGAATPLLSQDASPFGLQNYPAALRTTPDGERVAVGLWGVGDAAPEVLLFARGSATPVLASDLPGSVQALALDARGTRLAVAAKDVHSNLFGTTGAVRLLDTGERDLQLTREVRTGGTLAVALALAEPGQGLFALGFLRSTPRRTKLGEHWIDTSGPHFFRLVAGVGLRADLVQPIPPDASLVGLPLGIQAATLGASGVRLAATVLRPTVL
jgi:hypothetical protein